ncbi:triple tyrosine motif-containing protein, partial [Clostridium sp.]
RDYSSSKSFTWKPTNVGSYKISAYVKDVNSSNSVDAFKLLEYTIV